MLAAKIYEDGVVVATVLLQFRHRAFEGELYRGEAMAKMNGHKIKFEVQAWKVWPEEEE